MKKLLIGLLVFAGFMACENESIQELPQETSVTEGITAKKSNKIDVCHYDEEYDSWHLINISANAWKAHEKHGDVMLIDEDGDGWVTLENECGVPVDCDDTNAIFNEVCSFDCICDMVSTIQNSPSNFCYYYNPGWWGTDLVVNDFNGNYIGFVNIDVDGFCGGLEWHTSGWTIFTILGLEAGEACGNSIISAIDDCYSGARVIKDLPKAYKEFRNIK